MLKGAGPSGNCLFGDQPIPPVIFLQKHLVTDVQGFPQSLCHLLADGTFAVFHFGNMALQDAGHVGQLFLGKTFSISRSAQADPRKVLIGIFGVSLTPGEESEV